MIFKGTARRTAFQIAKEFDAIGGQTNAFTSMEHTCYHARVLDTQLGTMVDILSDIFLNSAFDSKEVERERPVIVQEIGMVEDTPEELVHVLMGPAFWGGHPLGRSILGSRENILGFDSQDASRGFSNGFISPTGLLSPLPGMWNTIGWLTWWGLFSQRIAALETDLPPAAVPGRLRYAAFN
jgi:hypothetical protein